MGYSMYHHESDVFLPAVRQQEAFEAIREHAPSVTVIEGPGQSYMKESPRSLDEALDLYGLTPERDDAGNIVRLGWDDELSGYEEITRMCERLWGLVRPGSYIQAEGSDGSIWRWVWGADGKLHVVEAWLVFDYPPEAGASPEEGKYAYWVQVREELPSAETLVPRERWLLDAPLTRRELRARLEPRLGRGLEEVEVELTQELEVAFEVWGVEEGAPIPAATEYEL